MLESVHIHVWPPNCWRQTVKCTIVYLVTAQFQNCACGTLKTHLVLNMGKQYILCYRAFLVIQVLATQFPVVYRNTEVVIATVTTNSFTNFTIIKIFADIFYRFCWCRVYCIFLGRFIIILLRIICICFVFINSSVSNKSCIT